MDEQNVKKRLRQGVFACIAMGVVVFVIALGVLHSLRNSFDTLIEDKMEAETIEYKNKITNQIERNLKALNTVAVILKDTDIANRVNFATVLNDANKQNDFVSMSYFDDKGMGIVAHTRAGFKANMDYRSLNSYTRMSINEAYMGNTNISPIFEGNFIKERVFIYSIPVVKNGKVAGVLVAGDYIKAFEELLEDTPIIKGTGSIHLIDGNGKVIISKEKIAEGTNLFNGAYFTKDDKIDVKDSMRSKSNHIFSKINIEGESYAISLEPVGINNWYVLCIHDSGGAARIAGKVVLTMAVTFMVLFLLILVLVAFIFRLIIINNRKLNRLAYTDSLTGADNMIRFYKNLKEARQRDGVYSIIALNVRQFKFVNEIFGREDADDILCTIYEAGKNSLKDGEFLCRDSADTFYLYFRESVKDKIKARIKALLDTVSACKQCENHDYKLQMYVGIYVHNEEKDSSISNEMLTTRAIFAMKQGKHKNKEIYFYDDNIHKDEEMKNYVESHMHQALAKGEFKLFLQPKLDLKTNEIGGAEALVRWITPENGMIYPGVFIPLFEENGFCVQLDLYMLEQVFKLISGWINRGIKPIPVSVNQSKLLFFENDYIESLQFLVDKYNVPSKLITLEILEGLALEHSDIINDKIKILRDLGFKISMDDFGSGYASFNTLGNLDIDELKLDRSFLMETAKSKTSRFTTIMASIIDLGKNLNIETVAEGVETKEDEELVRKLGCEFGQGYLYSKPISAEDFNSTYMKKH